MFLKASDVENKVSKTEFRGYNRDEVDAFLDTIIKDNNEMAQKTAGQDYDEIFQKTASQDYDEMSQKTKDKDWDAGF